uniref:CMP-N-acetylneuraminate-beta-galactosamide-alpha-2,3-sialyltransferase 4 n=2 Tax=Sus scrofa TaxID=9823 RepID=A0A8D0HYV9_PIG
MPVSSSFPSLSPPPLPRPRLPPCPASRGGWASGGCPAGCEGSGALSFAGSLSILSEMLFQPLGLVKGQSPPQMWRALILSSASRVLSTFLAIFLGRKVGSGPGAREPPRKSRLVELLWALTSALCPPLSRAQSFSPKGTCWDGGGWPEQGGDFCSDAFQVARGSRDDSSPQEPCYLRNMISKCRWKLLAMLAFVLVVMVWYSISREDRYIELFYFPILEKKEPCLQGEAERKVSKLFGNYSQEQPIFLQLKDYFWVKTPSAYELPYGTKGSEDLLLRVLAITSYSIPESIQRLKCRRCVVVGNGHRLRNSLLGEAINKYDVVIRLNNAPVAGYEGDVGSKTTMRLFYPESAHFNPKVEDNPDTLLVLVAFKAMDFHWIESILSDKKRVRKGFWKQPPLIWDVNPKQIRILNPFFMEIAADKLLRLPMQQPHKIKQKPTTGLLAITLALHLCDLVHIAGFGYPDAQNKKESIHYYEQITIKSMAIEEDMDGK